VGLCRVGALGTAAKARGSVKVETVSTGGAGGLAAEAGETTAAGCELAGGADEGGVGLAGVAGGGGGAGLAVALAGEAAAAG
jgi:hypothetical protein